MSEKISMILINIFTLSIVLIVQILTTRISRKNILLGVKLQEDKMKTDEVKNIIKGFIRETTIVGIFSIIFISILIYYIDNLNFFVFSTFLYLGILFLIYMRWNKRTKQLKKEKGWDKLAGKEIIVDTKFSKDRGKTQILSRKWFLIPLVIIVFSTVISFIMYPSLPNRVPTHWDLRGNIDGYMDKSILVALIMPITQLFIGLIMYFSYHVMVKSKQQINHRNPEDSLKKNLVFRRAWSIYFVAILTAIQITFTWSNFISLGIATNMKVLTIIQLIMFAFIILWSIALSIKLGQGGDRIKLDKDKEVTDGYDVDDDNLWKLGNTIYYNPNDPSIFVEKRVGVGWTLNAGRPLGMAIMILPFIITIAVMFFVK